MSPSTPKRTVASTGEQSGLPTIASHEALFALYDRMIGSTNIPDVLLEVMEVVCTNCAAERATVYLIDRETEQLCSVAVIGNVARTIKVPIRANSLSGYCALSGRTFLVPDAYGDLSDISPQLEFDRSWDKINNYRTRDVMCAPAMFKGEQVGVIQVMNSKSGSFQTEGLSQLGSIARLIGYTIHHAQLYDDLSTLKRLDQEKAQFMRVLVHELKSPAAAMKMLTDLLLDRLDLPADVANLHGRIASRMDQMLELISDILVLAKAKSGEAMGEIGTLDLSTITAEICDQYRPQAEQKGVTLTAELPVGALKIRIDIKGCNLIISNLVSNAVKYTIKGEVSVKLYEKDKWAVLDVHDSGIGIPEGDLSKLFKEFYRATNAAKHGIQGSGVGLASIKNIVERFDGELAVYSTENVGSTFTVRLPMLGESS